MNSNMIRHAEWPGQSLALDPMKQLFDKVFDGGFLRNASSDDSSVVTSQWTPRVDIKEESHRFILYADIPGVEPDAIEVQMDKGMLTIKGERKTDYEQSNDQFTRIERHYGAFHRRFALPDSADPDGITATGRNGVLQIVIPKRPETTPRRIRVNKTGADKH
jgi:HSP20 family protein